MRSSKVVTGVALPVLLAASLAFESCSSGNEHEATPDPSTTAPSTIVVDKCPSLLGLTGIRLVGPSKPGGFNAVNSGECVAIYNPDTSQTVGRIAQEQAFIIECVDTGKPVAFRVEAGDHSGLVNLGDELNARMYSGDYPEIPEC